MVTLAEANRDRSRNIAQGTLAALREAPNDAGIMAAIANAAEVRCEQGAHHAIDFTQRLRLPTHKARVVRFTKELRGQLGGNTALRAAVAVDVEGTGDV